jgi:ABC-type nickel/cobalt efflux system permease component RcnA
MHNFAYWLHGTFFHAWHWLFQQVQLNQWFGNIVAGVVTFAALTLVWPRLRHLVKRAIGITALHDSIHAKLDQQHRERLEQASKHHREAIALAKKHHEIHMAAIAKPASKPGAPVEKATPAKKAPKA